MTDERFDQMMRCALTPRSADSRLKQRLKAKMEDEQMTKKDFRRSIMVGVCGCLAFAGVVVAATNGIRRSTLSSSQQEEVFTYEQLPEAFEELGFSCNVPETLPGDYHAGEISVVDESAIGEDDTKLYSYKTLSVVYDHKGTNDIFLDIAKGEDLSWGVSEEDKVDIFDEEKEISGISVKASTMPFKFVPPDYRPTQEEEEAVKNHELSISYGTEEIEETTISNAQCEIGGLQYTICDLGGADIDAMFAMAGDVIEEQAG